MRSENQRTGNSSEESLAEVEIASRYACAARPSGNLRILDIEDCVLSICNRLGNSVRRGWHLRGRNSSLRSSEPHSAPSGIANQQSKNFQRFYRAVVSPTHVRVTAGGRIVPNTHAVAQPKFDWNPDRYLFEPSRQIPDTEANLDLVQDLHAPQPILASIWPPSQIPNYNSPMPSACLPIVHPSMAAQNIRALEGHAHASIPIAHATMAIQNLSASIDGHTHDLAENVAVKTAVTELLQPINSQQPIKISPPSQFDHSKPFLFNGQVVYPVPTGFQPPRNSVPLPLNGLRDSNLQHQITTNGSYFPSPYPIPMPLMMPAGPVGFPPMMFHNAGAHSEGRFPIAPYVPQSTSGLISLSELTKSQILGFRNQIKHIDDQIVNNKDQVDEDFLRRQRSELTEFMAKMENMLYNQLGQETNLTCRASLSSKTAEKRVAPSFALSATTSRKDTISNAGNTSDYPQSPPVAVEELKKKKTSSMAPPVPLFVPNPQQRPNHIRSEDAQVTITPVVSNPSPQYQPVPRSRLTVAAAKAPPFQPRTQTITHRPDPESIGSISRQPSKNSLELSHPAIQTLPYGAFGSRRIASSSSESRQLIPDSGVAHADFTREHRTQLPKVSTDEQSALLQIASTHHAPLSASDIANKPYLIGTVPTGMRPGAFSDILYSRPLTEDEIRARHLYWGDAPRTALRGSGLPKFDGKDFYPPSPVKSMARPATTSTVNLLSTTTSLDFKTLFTDPQLADCHIPPQGQADASKQDNILTSPGALVQNDIIGFQSPSPRPATYTFENSLPQDWSTTYSGNYEEFNKEQMTQAITATTVPEDFSTLFTSLSAPQHHHTTQSSNAIKIEPVTPIGKSFGKSDVSKEQEPKSQDPWAAPGGTMETIYRSLVDLPSIKTSSQRSESSSSTVEIRLSPDGKVPSPKRASGTVLPDRQANFSG